MLYTQEFGIKNHKKETKPTDMLLF